MFCFVCHYLALLYIFSQIISFQLIVTSSFVVSFKFRDPTFAGHICRCIAVQC